MLNMKHLYLGSSFFSWAQKGHSQDHSWSEYWSSIHQMFEPGKRGLGKTQVLGWAFLSLESRARTKPLLLLTLPSSAQLETHSEHTLPDLAMKQDLHPGLSHPGEGEEF